MNLSLGVPDGYGEGPLFLTGNTGEQWGTALTLGADSSFVTPKTLWSSTSSALDVMTPTSAGVNTLSDFWSQAGGVLLDVVKAGAGYAVAKDASKNNVVQPTEQRPVIVQQGGGGVQLGGLLPLLLIGGVVLFALKD